MPHPTSRTRPLDQIVRDRLQIKGENPVALKLFRGMFHVGDAIGRVFSGQPYFALRESEAMLQELEGRTGPALIQAVLARNGGTQFVPHGLENVPEQGPVVIAATHPTVLLDFVAHASVLLARRPDLKVVANQEAEKFLGPDLIIPVRIGKHNRPVSGRKARASMIRHLQQGGALLIFGSGRVADRRDGHLLERDWKRGATKVSRDTNAVIVPAALDARNSDAYYRLRALARMASGGNRKFGLMIGSMRYLADLMGQLGGRYHVHYGAPLAAGTSPDKIKALAENLVPGLYAAD